MIEETERIPRLVQERWRIGLATGISLPIGSYVVLFVLYQVLTWRRFARLDPARLTRWTAATTPRTVAARWVERWLGFGSLGLVGHRGRARADGRPAHSR